jgi:hypothetical protein
MSPGLAGGVRLLVVEIASAHVQNHDFRAGWNREIEPMQHIGRRITGFTRILHVYIVAFRL